MGTLFLEFLGEGFEVEPGETLTFGRSADLVVDASNQYLHRVLGCFASQGEVWFLQNLGRYIPLRIFDRDGPSRTELAPGDQAPIGFEEFTIVFEAGPSTYEIVGALAEPTPLELGRSVATDTVEFATLNLNHEQRLLVAALAEPLLRGHPDWQSELPGNKEVARRLGWSLAKFNRKLDYLCRRLAEQGVEGMQGGSGALATTRRARLVRHMVDRSLVTLDDLDLLPPRP
jgi:hypothetical protein